MYKSYKFYKSILICISEWILPPEGWFCQKWSHMINTRISAVWSKTKTIAPFSCTPRVQEVHTKAEVVHLTPGLLGLGVLFNIQALEMYCETYD